MDVLSSRILLRPADPGRSRRFYRDTLGLAVHREFVFFLGSDSLEVSGVGDAADARNIAVWVQVRDLPAEHPLRRDTR